MKTFSEVKVSAPSKVILHGEHAVVYGYTAVAASLDLRTRMRIKPHKSLLVVNFPDVGLSDSWTPAQLAELFRNKPVERIDQDVDHVYLDCIHNFLKVDQSNLRMASMICFLYLYSIMMEDTGIVPMEILVESEIPLGAGLGSSAALSVCLAAGLTGVRHQVQGIDKNIFTCLNSTIKKEVCKFAFLSEKILHGNPSGIDNSISTYGGLCKFSQEISGGKIGCLTPIPVTTGLKILLINTHVNRNTKDLVALVRDKYETYPKIIKPILESIDGISHAFLALLERTEGEEELNFRAMEDMIECNHFLLASLGVSHRSLEDVCTTAKQFGMRGKLTGAGGGGFAFTLIPPNLPEKSVKLASAALESHGYTCHQANVGVSGFSIELATTASK